MGGPESSTRISTPPGIRAMSTATRPAGPAICTARSRTGRSASARSACDDWIRSAAPSRRSTWGSEVWRLRTTVQAASKASLGSTCSQVPGGGADTTRVLAIASGASADLGAAPTCHAAGTAWVVCDPATETLAPIVLDQQGRRTALASAEPVRDPVPGAPVAYYEVTGGSYRGIVDATGAWRYRMSLYTRLED